MNISKVKLKDDRVIIEYEKKSDVVERNNQFALACADEPLPEFTAALTGLARYVLEICELPEDMLNRVKVTGVTYSSTGAVVTAQISLLKSNCPLNINTPHVAESEMTPMCVTALQHVRDEAKRYVLGERAQGELFKEAV